MRLDKFIAQATELSRNDAKKAMKARRITVNDEVAIDPARHINNTDTVLLDEQELGQAGPRYFMLHKPAGYVCATRDSEHPTVLDLLDEPRKEELQIAGRLDIDTTGLVLLTDDGQWNHKVTSPKHHCLKTYYACLADALIETAEVQLQQGVMLDGETKPTKPAVLERLYSNEVRLTISEGKYHQVKRMFAALGNRVLELHRESVGAILLDPELESGAYRPLTEAEVHSITSSIDATAK